MNYVLVSVTLVLLVCIGTQAQEVSANGHVGPIKLRLKTTADKVCIESFVPLELKIINNTNEYLEIRELDVLRDYTIYLIADDGSHKLMGSLGLWPGTTREEERLRNEIHNVKPHENYTTAYKLSLWDRAFPRPGKYLLRTYYKQSAASNVVGFEILNCNSN